jgi:hypothetical protein
MCRGQHCIDMSIQAETHEQRSRHGKPHKLRHFSGHNLSTPHSTHVTKNKKGGNSWTVPYRVPFTHENVQGYDVTESQQVKPLTDVSEILESASSVDDAIQLYLDAFSRQFIGKHGLIRKRQYLQRFKDHLTVRGHTLQTADLSLDDGQRFIDGLTNKFTGAPVSDDKRNRYKGALRSLSRFLFLGGMINQDVFRDLKVQTRPATADHFCADER